MSSADLPKELNDMLAELAIETDLSREAVDEAIAAFPDYRERILRYVIDFHAMDDGNDDEGAPSLPPVVLPSGSAAQPVDPFAGMTAAELKVVASACDIPLSILSKLEDRAIKLESVPLLLVTRLASSLQTKIDVLLGFLELAPTLSPSTSYRSDQTPQVADKIDFATAIKNTRMDEAQRARWLSLSE